MTSFLVSISLTSCFALLTSIEGLGVVTFGATSGDLITFGSPLSLDFNTGQVGAHLTPHYRATPELQNTARMFTFLLNQVHGGVRMNGTVRKLCIILVDDKGTPEGVTEATRHLITDLGVKLLLGPATSFLTEPAAAVADESGAVMVAGNAASPSVFSGRPKVFGILTPAPLWPKLAVELVAAKGAKTIGYLHEDNGLQQLMCSNVQRFAADVGMRFTKGIKGPPNWDAGGDAAVLDMKAAEPDVVVICAYENIFPLILESMRKQEFTPKMIVTGALLRSSFYNDTVLPSMRFIAGFELWSKDAPLTSPWASGMTAASFAHMYEKQYGSEPTWVASSAWAALETLVQAIETAGKLDLDLIQSVLEAIDIKTLFGQVRFDSNRQNTNDFKVVQHSAASADPFYVAPMNTEKFIYPMPEWEERKCLVMVTSETQYGYEKNGGCISCPETAVFDHISQRRECTTCRPEDSVIECQLLRASTKGDNTTESTDILLAVSISISAAVVVFFAIGICLLRKYLRRRRQKRLDSPGRSNTESGSWTLKWVGPHVHESLTQSTESRLHKSHPTGLDVWSACLPPLGSGTQSMESIVQSVTGSGTQSMESIVQSVEHTLSWCVNATPFDVQLVRQDSLCIKLDTMKFCKAWFQGALQEIQVTSPDSEISAWKRLSQKVILQFDDSCWSSAGYDATVARLDLPCSYEGNRLGQLKLVCGPRDMLLIMWSPATEIRGMPLDEFKQFFNDVVGHPGVWDCTIFTESGEPDIVQKKKNDPTRNMYDACTHMICPTVGRVDASYAEVLTACGPPDLFISHVWAETAANTLKSIMHLMTSRRASIASANQNIDCRVWFCTCCNNQTRVKQELGSDVAKSPFARVISSSRCTQVALISPLLALERKWCTFEFSFAVSQGKEVTMLTTQGIVGSGHVSPKTLGDLAARILRFECAHATCATAEDAALIDTAIIHMGGFEKLDATLKSVFFEAVEVGHSFSMKAVEQIRGDPFYLNGFKRQMQTDSSEEDVSIDGKFTL